MVAMGAVPVKDGDNVVAVLSVASDQPGVLDRFAPPDQLKFAMQCPAWDSDMLLQLACKCLTVGSGLRSWLSLVLISFVSSLCKKLCPALCVVACCAGRIHLPCSESVGPAVACKHLLANFVLFPVLLMLPGTKKHERHHSFLCCSRMGGPPEPVSAGSHSVDRRGQVASTKLSHMAPPAWTLHLRPGICGKHNDMQFFRF